MKNRLFGCEFEFSSDWDDAEPVVKEAIQSVYGSHKLTIRKDWMRSYNNRSWHLKEDASTTGEIATPVSKGKDLDRICRVVELIDKGGIKTSLSDGFHVHVQASDVDPRYVVAAWARIEKPMLSIFPKHRRRNDYCEAISRPNRPGFSRRKRPEFCSMMEIAREHHSSISLSRRKRRGTVEFRLAEGTFDPDFVWHWVTFCLRFIEKARSNDPYELLMDKEPNPSLRQVLNEMGLSSSFRAFEDRRRRFGGV